ncbi:hypothetical protein ZIOFF_070513 [Zingiber officinale]|uniref:Uncharacterized protein n=1 Tax=Zingiber officinale TaxID=94328 RepID=A0A8J5C777_ZINOF|nr:hypothetical protein ZIOFF_070513 [Zingiber officinale]
MESGSDRIPAAMAPYSGRDGAIVIATAPASVAIASERARVRIPTKVEGFVRSMQKHIQSAGKHGFFSKKFVGSNIYFAPQNKQYPGEPFCEVIPDDLNVYGN